MASRETGEIAKSSSLSISVNDMKLWVAIIVCLTKLRGWGMSHFATAIFSIGQSNLFQSATSLFDYNTTVRLQMRTSTVIKFLISLIVTFCDNPLNNLFYSGVRSVKGARATRGRVFSSKIYYLCGHMWKIIVYLETRAG